MPAGPPPQAEHRRCRATSGTNAVSASPSNGIVVSNPHLQSLIRPRAPFALLLAMVAGAISRPSAS